MDKVLKFLGGIVLGSLIGASLALLFAPDSGENLRKQIQDEISGIQTDVMQAAKERRLELEQQLTELRSPNKPEQL